VQLAAGGEPDAGDVAAVVRAAQQPRQRIAAAIVDGAAPARGFQRLLAKFQLTAQQ
jgi:hypothetical protein